MTHWPVAFWRWIRSWRRYPLDPDYLRSYRKAFRAGWRAAMRESKRGRA